MAGGPSESTARDQQLHDVIAAYYEAVEAGRPPDQRELLARYPELAAELASFFADKEQFERLAEPLRPAGREGRGPAGPAHAAGPPAGEAPTRGFDPNPPAHRASAPAEAPTGGPAAEALTGGFEPNSPPRPASSSTDTPTAAFDPRTPASPAETPTIGIASDTPALGPDPSPTASSKLGRVRYIGNYELLEEIARGGMGVVYQARQMSLQRTVALKMILAGEHAGSQDLARFQAEAQAVARLQHPNIVQIYEVGAHEGRPYIALEFVEGGSLAQRLEGTPLPARQAAQLVETLARAIQAAHQRGIVHRDLKPANVLLTAEGTPKVTDFGLAKLLDSEAGQTQSGAILGTPSYMSPEQAGGLTKQIGPLTDVYALGAILYELLTGRPPFRAATPLDTILQVVSEEPVPPGRLQPMVPRDLETICLKCLAKEPGRRYASAEALADDLGRFLAGEPVVARSVGPSERLWRWCRRNPVVAGSVGAVALVLLAATAISSCFAVQARTEKRRANGQAAEAQANAWQAEREKRRADDRAAEAQANARRADREARLVRDQKRILDRRLYDSQMNLAQRAWEDAQIGRLGEILESQPEDLRGFEWSYWWRLCHSGLTLKGHTGLVFSVAFSPDGKRLASSSWDQTVKLWDNTSGHEVRTLKGHAGPVTSVAFSPDGKRLASGARDGMVRLWDSTSGQEVRTLRGHTGQVLSVAFSPDGKRLASGSEDLTVKLWDSASGQEVRTLKGHAGLVFSVAFSPDGKRLASGAGDGTVKLWDSASGQEVLTLKGHAGPVLSVAFSPDGKRLASGAGDNSVKLWDSTSGQEVLTLKGHTHQVHSRVFNPDGKRLASASYDETVKLWDASTGQEVVTLKLKGSNGFHSVAFSPDGKRLASGSYDGRVRLWDSAGGREEVRGQGPGPPPIGPQLLAEDLMA